MGRVRALRKKVSRDSIQEYGLEFALRCDIYPDDALAAMSLAKLALVRRVVVVVGFNDVGCRLHKHDDDNDDGRGCEASIA